MVIRFDLFIYLYINNRILTNFNNFISLKIIIINFIINFIILTIKNKIYQKQ